MGVIVRRRMGGCARESFMEYAAAGVGISSGANHAISIWGWVGLSQIEIFSVEHLTRGLKTRGIIRGCNLSAAPTKVK